MIDVAAMDHGRLSVRVTGLVQGVGFRPFVYRAAADLGLNGFVENNDRGVDIEVEGDRVALEAFLDRVEQGAPPLASVASVEVSALAPVGTNGFQIRLSERHGTATTQISPDAAICDDCLRELFDLTDRRYRYPFINCTNCGPRYTIVEAIPYDRPLTSMKGFRMCPDCSHEYHDPSNRRFHAQPNACPVCGPQPTLIDREGKSLGSDRSIERVQELLAEGHIVAVKGLGGFHLAVNPHDDAAVRRLRERKGRAEKPFALMARNLEAVCRYCNVTPDDERALKHRARPIVLLEARDEHGLAESVVPLGRTELGFMLPYTPLHYLLLDGPFEVLVMTSANLAEEPIAIGNEEACRRLGEIADCFLVHDRDILQRCDDSVVRVVDGEMAPIRRSRGFVPDPVSLPFKTPKPILACGGELKNTIGLARGNSVFLSQHIGDLDNPYAYEFFDHSVRHLESILEIEPEVIAFDMHPEYLSTKWASAQKGLQPVAVQHHHAHLAAVMAENGVTGPTIGIILDGTGYGTDGTIWGGEVLVGDLAGFERFGWLQPFALPGGTAAIKHPWRTAYALVREALASPACPNDVHLAGPTAVPTWLSNHLLPFKTTAERDAFDKVIGLRINTPMTSSCGRLFDGVSALLGLCREVTYEAQAAIALDRAATIRTPEDAAEGRAVTPEGPAVTPAAIAVDRAAMVRSPEDGAEGRAVTPAAIAVDRAATIRTPEDVAEGWAVTPGFSPGQEKPQIDSRAGFNPREPLSDDLFSAAELKDRGPLDWTPIVRKVVHDLHAGTPKSVIAKSFHFALSDLFVNAAIRAREETGINRVGLSGGVFQNQLLLRDIKTKLENAGFDVIVHRLVPTNDGGLAYGQAAVAADYSLHRTNSGLQAATHRQTDRLID